MLARGASVIGSRAGIIRSSSRLVLRPALFPSAIRRSMMANVLPKAKQRYNAMEAIQKVVSTIDSGNTTFILNVNLNIDPRMDGHKLRGAFELPHRTGKYVRVMALTTNEDLAVSALQVGARFAGDFADALTINMIMPENYDRVVATKCLQDVCVKPINRPARHHSSSGMSRLVRQLRNNKMTPTVEDHTLVEPEEFVEAVRKHVNGAFSKFTVTTDGCVATTMGMSRVHTPEQLIENMNAILRHLYTIQPVDFGQGPRGKPMNVGRYVLSMHLGVSNVLSLPLNLADVLKEVDDISLYAGL